MSRRLTRSRDAIVGGVAAGVANWLRADPALVRIAWAILVPLTGGAALLAYIVAWIVVPEEPRRTSAATDAAAASAAGASETEAVADDARAADRTAYLIGGGLVLLGLWFLVREYVPAIRWDLVWPVVLVVAGLAVLVTASRRR
jgi:phage shock protein C